MLRVERQEEYNSDKILSMYIAAQKIDTLKSEGQTVGLCHGGFDLMHPGHIKHFESAKELCDVLFVSVTSDKFVAGRKGSGRPVFSDALRAYSIASLASVDYAVVSDFEKGTEVINLLKPNYYIKGPDFINKNTPGITEEREAIRRIGGEMKYTNDPAFSTTQIIKYVKEDLDRPSLLAVLDRDGTLIEEVDYIGRSSNWKDEFKLKKDVVDFLVYLKTKADATFVVVSNQGGVAMNYFDCERVNEINKHLDDHLRALGISVNSWKYCPDVDVKYASSRSGRILFNPDFVKEITKRKPSLDMVVEALGEMKKNLGDFSHVVVLGDRDDDAGLARNLKCPFIDVRNKNYNDLKNSFSLT
jgi:rfaE bifunctional protein nucleotidyltransferase chain/domain